MLVPWQILSVNPPDVTFRGFYYLEGTRFIEGGSNSAQLAIQWHNGNVCPPAYYCWEAPDEKLILDK